MIIKKQHTLGSRWSVWTLTLLVTFSWATACYADHHQKTLAILPFENNAITERERYEPLSQGLAAMLTSDLAANASDLQLVERSRIQSLLSEVGLGQSGALNSSSALQAGKLLGTQHIAFGSFVVMGEMVRIDSRIIKVETSELVMAESVQGSAADFLGLQQSLAVKIAAALESAFSRTQEQEGDISAALAFSQGLAALDAGDVLTSKRLFAEAVEKDPGYKDRIALVTDQKLSTAGASNLQADKVVTVEGYSVRSRSDAIQDAQRNAVEQAMGVLIQSETEMANFEIQRDKVMSRSQGYVTQFDVLSSDKSEDGVYIVNVRATVSLARIQDDLVAMNILLDRLERPSVMVLVEEDYLSMDDLQLNVAETELTSALDARGFDLVDQTQLQKIQDTEQQRQALAGNTAAAQALGFDLGAEFVILGKAIVQDNGEVVAGSGMKSIQASIQLRIIQTQTGVILGSVVKNGVAAHVSPVAGATQALKQSVEIAVDEYIVNAITESFQDFLNNGAPLKLIVEGVTSFKQSKAVLATLEDLEEVVSSKQLGWNRKGGLLTLDLRFKGSANDLAELLDGKNLVKSKLQVNDVSPDRVSARLQ